MKPWLLTVAILFVLAEAVLWVKSFILPLPVYVFAGAFLAIASNYDRGMSSFFRAETIVSTIQNSEKDVILQTASLVEETPLLEAKDK